MSFRVSRHAREEAARRSIPAELMDAVLSAPEQIAPAAGGDKAYQSKVDFGGGRIFLLRVIVDDRVSPPVVVTVYRTSKIDKYWRKT